MIPDEEIEAFIDHVLEKETHWFEKYVQETKKHFSGEDVPESVFRNQEVFCGLIKKTS